jgi:hypothetical protein
MRKVFDASSKMAAKANAGIPLRVRRVEATDGTLIVRKDGSFVMEADSIAVAVRLIGEWAIDCDIGEIELHRAPKRNLRIKLGVVELALPKDAPNPREKDAPNPREKDAPNPREKDAPNPRERGAAKPSKKGTAKPSKKDAAKP